METNESGAISKESAIKLGFASAILAACIGAAVWAGKFMTVVERTSADVNDIKLSIRDMSHSIQRVNDIATRNMVKVESLESRMNPK